MHNRISDESYQEMRDEAVETQRPLTRAQLAERARAEAGQRPTCGTCGLRATMADSEMCRSCAEVAEVEAEQAEQAERRREVARATAPHTRLHQQVERLAAPILAHLEEVLAGDRAWAGLLLEVQATDWDSVRAAVCSTLDSALVITRADLEERRAMADGEA